MTFEVILLAGSAILLAAIVASRLSGRFGVPALVLYIVIGMLAGSEGFGGIHFNNAALAQELGVAALALILFSGGLDTDWTRLGRVWKAGISLATVGILVTAGLVAAFAHYTFGLSPLVALLLGAIVSATDAAAVFSVLKARNTGLKRDLQPLLEFESGSNDPMAVFLTVTILRIMAHPVSTPVDWILWFVQQAGVGMIVGVVMGRAIPWIINRAKLDFEGLYPVMTLGLVLAAYALAAVMGGSGFLAVYLAGLLMGQRDFLYKKAITRFHDGVAWLMQIVMFVALGLLVFPSRLPSVALLGMAFALFLVLIARPAATFAALAFTKMSVNEKWMVSWVGLRGAAPIVLATFPMLAGVPRADLMFDLVFFIVLVSVLVQGTSVSWVAERLGVSAPPERRMRSPIEVEQTQGSDMDLMEYIIPFGGAASGKALYELNLPTDCLIALICRNEKFLVATGKTVMEEGDVVMTLVNRRNRKMVQSILQKVGA